jgi:hypothetical protein
MAQAIKQFSIESYQKVYNTFAHKVISIFNEEEKLSPQIFFISLDTSQDSNVGEYVQLDPEIVANMQTPEGQEAMWELLTECVTDGSEAHSIIVKHFDIAPDVVVHVTACWIAPDTEEGLPPSHAQDRSEALLVSVHTPLAVFLGSCPIDEINRVAEFGPMDPKPCSLQWSSMEDMPEAPPPMH